MANSDCFGSNMCLGSGQSSASMKLDLAAASRPGTDPNRNRTERVEWITVCDSVLIAASSSGTEPIEWWEAVLQGSLVDRVHKALNVVAVGQIRRIFDGYVRHQAPYYFTCSESMFNMCITFCEARLMTRFLSYSIDGTQRFGLLTADGEGIVDLTDRMSDASDLGQLIDQARLDEARTHVGSRPDQVIGDITFERLLPWPRKIFCIGVNYGGRSAEYADKTDAAYPSVFVRFPDSFTGHGQTLLRPPESPQLDYEGEIVVVIGKPGRRIPVSDARSHIAGLSLGNEGTIRDWVRHAKFNVTQGKNWESTGSFGPWLVPIDEIGAFEDLRITTHVNAEVRQDDSPATMKYSIEYQIHYLSTFTMLRPGDVIFSGTPTGAGARFDPPIWLEPGDVVEVSVPELGTLSNTIADEFPDGADFAPPEPQ